MNWFVRRLSEPSTWAGIAAVIFGGSGLTDTPFSHVTPDFLAAVGATVTGLVAIFKGSPSVRKDEAGLN